MQVVDNHVFAIENKEHNVKVSINKIIVIGKPADTKQTQNSQKWCTERKCDTYDYRRERKIMETRRNRGGVQ
jgi:hypothetical protein